MARINVYTYEEFEGKTLAGHFNHATAEEFKEGTRWDGHNHVSVHTSDQFAHQVLYRTKGGRWVLCNWSQWESVDETHEFVTDDQAREWLLIAENDAAVERYFGAIEDERGPGRPAIGPAVNIRFDGAVVARLDARAAAEGISRADLVRQLVDAGL